MRKPVATVDLGEHVACIYRDGQNDYSFDIYEHYSSCPDRLIASESHCSEDCIRMQFE